MVVSWKTGQFITLQYSSSSGSFVKWAHQKLFIVFPLRITHSCNYQFPEYCFRYLHVQTLFYSCKYTITFTFRKRFTIYEVVVSAMHALWHSAHTKGFYRNPYSFIQENACRLENNGHFVLASTCQLFNIAQIVVSSPSILRDRLLNCDGYHSVCGRKRVRIYIIFT